jgi:CarD family transcriptional regulator
VCYIIPDTRQEGLSVEKAPCHERESSGALRPFGIEQLSAGRHLMTERWGVVFSFKELASARPANSSFLGKLTNMASNNQFTTGDYVVYPTHGVGRVVALETQEIAGLKLQLYVIGFEKDRMTLRVPVAKALKSGLRKLSTRKIMESALTTLRGRARVKRTMWSRRAQEYEAKINSGDPVSIAEVVRDLHRSASQPDQSYSERQIYEAALDRLAAELAAVEKIDAQAATKRLESLLEAA